MTSDGGCRYYRCGFRSTLYHGTTMCAVKAVTEGLMSGSVGYDTVAARPASSSSLMATVFTPPERLKSLQEVERGAAGPGSWRSGTRHA